MTTDRTFNRRVDLSLLHWFDFCGVGSRKNWVLGSHNFREGTWANRRLESWSR